MHFLPRQHLGYLREISAQNVLLPDRLNSAGFLVSMLAACRVVSMILLLKHGGGEMEGGGGGVVYCIYGSE